MTSEQDDPSRTRSWALVVQHRQRLVHLAMAMGLSRADAEDCAHDSMMRVVALDSIDERTLGGLLTTVTKRAAIDQHRTRDTQLRAWHRHGGRRVVEAAPDEQVCDVAQAQHARRLLPHLPASERSVIELRAAGLSTSQAAQQLGVTPKSAESALTRARARLVRRVVVVGGALALARDRLGVTTSPVWATTAGAAVAVGVVVLPLLHGPAPSSSASEPDTATLRPPAAAARATPGAADAEVAEPPGTAAAGRRPTATPAARPAVTPRPDRVVSLPPRRVGPAWTGQWRVEHHPDDPVSAIQSCVNGGLVVSPSFIGCPPSTEPRPAD